MNRTKQREKSKKKPLWIILVILGVVLLGFLGYIVVDIFFRPTVVEKPLIYLYPEEELAVKVRVTPREDFLVTYPEYKEGWYVVARPDGTLINIEDGREYSYLFWEAPSGHSAKYDLSKGFVVKGSETMQFLQQKLEEIGLNEKEYNEFIVYWLPRMIGNEYNLIHFATEEEYDSRVPLEIEPQPDSILRVFMVFKPLKQKVDVEEQVFEPFKREGFTVLEWGGSEL